MTGVAQRSGRAAWGRSGQADPTHQFYIRRSGQPAERRFTLEAPGRSHGFFLDWDEVADGTVGSLRAEAGRNPLDRSLTDLIGELTARSHPFATGWAQHDVRLHRTATKRLHNSVVGDLELTGDALELAGDGLTVIAYTAEPGSAAEEKLALLGSWQRSKATTKV